MATRKIRLTMSGTQIAEQGPIIDVDFNGTNLDADVDVNAVYGTATVVKEYTVDVDAGTYNLDIEFKNDAGGDVDRNLVIEKIEYSNDGTNYNPYFVTEENSNLSYNSNISPNGYIVRMDGDTRVENPDYDPGQPRTDGDDYNFLTDPGPNNKRLYDIVYGPITIYTSSTATFNISFS